MIVGIDEAGRGCWAGPLVAAAVVLPSQLKGLTDSKNLSNNQRQKLATAIKRHALAIGIGRVPGHEVDSMGLTATAKIAMHQALMQINKPYARVVIDGSDNFLNGVQPARIIETVIKADVSI